MTVLTRSRRPTSPAQTGFEVEAEDRAPTQGQSTLGARTIHTQLRRAGAPHVPAISTVHRVLQWNSLILQPRAHRAVPAWRGFERDAPNDLWPIDGTRVALAHGSPAWIIDILDDAARFAGTTTTNGHQSLHQQLPSEKYQALPKVSPGDPRPRRRKTGTRVLRVSSAATSTSAAARSASAKGGKASRSPSSRPHLTRSSSWNKPPPPSYAN